ncbi:hypothetical protein Tco_0832553 [Tanacetum coccineum]
MSSSIERVDKSFDSSMVVTVGLHFVGSALSGVIEIALSLNSYGLSLGLGLGLGLGHYLCYRLVPSCCVIFDLEPFSLSFDSVDSKNLFDKVSSCTSLFSLLEPLKADNTIRVNQLVTILLIESSIHLLDQNLYPVDPSLIHIESRKSPTAVLFEDDTGRIYICHCEY